MIDIAKAFEDFLGSLEPSIDIWPDYQAAVIRNGLNDRREGVKCGGSCRRPALNCNERIFRHR
jgi:hypothetical protein